MWKSKLGNEFDAEDIWRNEKRRRAELDEIRRLPENRICADCGNTASGNVWASVNLGVFVCMRCGSLHRGLGTHISIPKGCTGTYLWGPDEIEQMRRLGNDRAKQKYGGGGGGGGGGGTTGTNQHQCPAPDASDLVWMRYLQDKYVLRKFAPPPQPQVASGIPPPSQDLISFDDTCSFGGTEEEVTERKPAAAVNEKNDDFFSSFGL